ncbi:MAG: MOSC domain-containing protein [Hungatella sp.]
MGKVVAICISEKRGTQKVNIHTAEFLENFGIAGDAHAGNWHRQVSLISKEQIDAFKARGVQVQDGAFGENLIVEGFDFKNLPVGTVLACNGVVLEMTQIGKECHAHCEIYKQVGDCIMPREGVFAVVKHGGTISEGDEMHLVESISD